MTDLIKRFYSTFIRYFLIKLVFLYVYKWIQSHSAAVYMCKEEYLILLILLNWRRLLAQIVKIGSFLRTRPGVFLPLRCGRLFDPWRPPHVGHARGEGVRKRSRSSHQWIRIFEIHRNPNCHFNAHLNHGLSLLSLFFLPYRCLLPCV